MLRISAAVAIEFYSDFCNRAQPGTAPGARAVPARSRCEWDERL
jgi:hypothetical protein